MDINLRSTGLFKKDKISFDRAINFVYGRNGTGKSTITRLINEQLKDDEKYDVFTFQGFDNLLRGNEKLNCITLGEENGKTQEEIDEKENLIRDENVKINEITKEMKKLLDSNKRNSIDEPTKIYDHFKNITDGILKQCSRKISEYDNNIKIINDKKYVIINLKKELGIYKDYEKLLDSEFKILPNDKFKILSDNEVTELLQVLKSEIKNAKKIENIDKPDIDLNKILNEVNEILKHKVEVKVNLERIGQDAEKLKFAEDGVKIHKSGDKCAFCGSMVTQELLNELSNYFSQDMEKFQEKIQNKKKFLEEYRNKLDDIKVNQVDFYPDKVGYFKDIKIEISDKRSEYIKFLNELICKLNEKDNNIFKVIDEVSHEHVPTGIREIINKYNNLVEENNSNILFDKQKEARDKLRFYEIKKYLDENNFIDEIEKLKKAKEYLNKIESHNEKIKGIQGEITKLKSQMKNVEKAVENINKKLKLSNSLFELFYNGEGYYQVKCLRTLKEKGVQKLSTGEKNIIAFLYFIESLDDIKKKKSNTSRVIVFDDPMNSNDDTNQYLIITELQKMIKKLKNEKAKLIILTHNCHFYLNVKYGNKYKCENNNNFCNFFRLVSDNKFTDIKNILDRKHDIKTSYDLLWEELSFIFHSDVSASLLCNPMRRIIETYTKFNCIDIDKFYGDQYTPLKKLFNVNSHSIEDLEHDLSGTSKQELIEGFKSYFKDNNAEEHFKQHFEKAENNYNEYFVK